MNDTETTAPPFRLPRVTLPRQPEPPVSAAEREAGDQALGLTERQRDQAALERLRAERLASTRHDDRDGLDGFRGFVVAVAFSAGLLLGVGLALLPRWLS